MSRVLVTGASGFIGGHVAEELRAAGWEVRCLVRPASMAAAARLTGCEVVPGDVTDAPSVRRAARGVDAVVHAAACYTLARHRAAEVWAANDGGTANVLAAARAAGARLVHTSSVATVGIPPHGLGDERTPLTPGALHGAYKRSKLAAERRVLAAAADGWWATVVNPTAPVGPGDRAPTPTGRIVRDAAAGRMPAYVDTGLNLVDVRDVAAGHRLALERGVPGRRYILGGENLSLQEILRIVARLAGRRPPRVRLPHGAALAVAGVSELVEGTLLRREPLAPLDGARMARTRMWVDPSRARRELGVPFSPVDAALADAVRWYAAAGRSAA